MPKEPSIHRLDASHVEEIISLWKRSELPHKPKGRDKPDKLTERIEEGTDVFFGCFSGDKLIAVVLATHDGRKGWINRLAVDPRERGRGLAVRLIKRAEDYFSERGIEIYAVLVEDYNQASLALFRKCGYVLHGDINYLSKRKNPDV